MRLSQAITGALSAIAVWLAVPSQALAQGAPAQLRGKSIVLNWTEHRMQRAEGEADFKPVNSNQTLQMYVSTEGRVFERRSATRQGKRTRTGSKDSVDGGAIAGTASTSRFSGRSLVLAGAMRQGGRHVSVEFDQGFSSCTVQVTIGREAGTDLIKGRSLTTGKRIAFQSQGTSGASCSIRDGNVFAQ